jgi:hypothetical protein
MDLNSSEFRCAGIWIRGNRISISSDSNSLTVEVHTYWLHDSDTGESNAHRFNRVMVETASTGQGAFNEAKQMDLRN